MRFNFAQVLSGALCMSERLCSRFNFGSVIHIVLCVLFMKSATCISPQTITGSVGLVSQVFLPVWGVYCGIHDGMCYHRNIIHVHSTRCHTQVRDGSSPCACWRLWLHISRLHCDPKRHCTPHHWPSAGHRLGIIRGMCFANWVIVLLAPIVQCLF